MIDIPPPGARLYYDFTTDPFCQKALDRSMINRPFENLLTNSQFVDSDGDGVPDSWISTTQSGFAGNVSIENESIKIEITASPSTPGSNGIQIAQWIDNVVPGQAYSCKCIAKVGSSDVVAMIRLAWHDGTSFLSGTLSASTSLTEDTELIIENAVAPANAVRARLMLRLIVASDGNTGIGWFKAPVLIRHSRLSLPDKSAYLYGPKWTPEGLEFDGVDDYCIVENNTDADITVATPEKPLTFGIVTRPTEASSMFALSKNYEGTTTYQYAIYYNGSDNKRLQAIMSSLSNSYSPGIDVNVGELVYYVVSYNGLTIKEYKNGLLSGSVARTGALISRPYFYLGCKMNNPTSGSRSLFYKGTISEVYIGHAQPDELISWFERTGRFEKYGIPR